MMYLAASMAHGGKYCGLNSTKPAMAETIPNSVVFQLLTVVPFF
jgi:hypothetical protein